MKAPSKATLKKYGMTEVEWWARLDAQAGGCAICGAEGRMFNIDHFHHYRFKKLRPEERVKLVRGILCNMCNRFLLGPTRYGFKAEDYRRAADYLDRWAWLAEHQRAAGRAP